MSTLFQMGVEEILKPLTNPVTQPVFVPILYLVLRSLDSLFSLWTTSDRNQDEQNWRPPDNLTEFDFIIVGAGSAGCLLANRLSLTYNVLLLEAGGEPHPLQFIPAFALFLINYPEVDWMHRSTPQKWGSLMSVSQRSSWSTGLGLGGTGNLNLMIHLRGHWRDFDNWARITGDPGWGWEGVLPYFKSYEDYEEPGDSENHGYNGDLRVEAPDFIGRAWDFVSAGMELGYPNVDLNAPFDEGFDILRYPIKRGVRQAPYKAFLEPIRSRPTLSVIKFAHVNKVLFRDGNVAYGVEYDKFGKTYMAHAKKEVILSAGSVGSPKLLLLSGVGPKSQLEELNIPVVSNLPVGKNMQDHLGVYLGPFFIEEGKGTSLERDYTPLEFVRYFTLGQGRLTSSGAEATGIISSQFAKARGEGDWPDIHYFCYAFTTFKLGAELLAKSFSLKLDEVMQYFAGSENRDAVYVTVSGARPFARGYLRLGGSSPYDNLIINPNYLGDRGEIDLKVLLEGVKKAVYLMENTTAGREAFGAQFTTNLLPRCEHLRFRSNAYWECYIRRYSVTLHHPVGTVAMGSVVDTGLRVKGTHNLRVVDASIQPVLVVTNTQASTLMIAEKGADMIDSFWRAYEIFKGNGSYNISTTTTTTATTTITQEPILGNGNDVVGNNTKLLYNININHVGDGYDDEKSNYWGKT